MSYVKTVWETGDIITAEKLNNLEDGVAQAGELLKVNINVVGSELVLDKTYKEIKDALLNSVYVYIVRAQTLEGYYELDIINIIALTESGGNYSVVCGDMTFEITNENGYPAMLED